MPAKTPRQQRYMAMVSHHPGTVRKGKGKLPSKAVAQKYSKKPRGGYSASRKR